MQQRSQGQPERSMSLPLRQETQVVLRRGEGRRKPQPLYGIGPNPKVGGSNPPLPSGSGGITTGDGQVVPKWQVGRLQCIASPRNQPFQSVASAAHAVRLELNTIQTENAAI